MKKIILAAILCSLSTFIFAQELTIEQKRQIRVKNSYIVDAQFSPFRNYFAYLTLNNSLEIFDRNWNTIYKAEHGEKRTGAGKLAFSPDGQFLAVSKYSTNNDIILIRLKDQKIMQILRGKSFTINDLCFSNDGLFLAAAYDDEAIIWKLIGGRLEKSQEFTEYSGEISNIDFSYNDMFVVSTDNDGFLTIFKRKGDSYKEYQKIKDNRSYIYKLDYHPRNDQFIVSNSKGATSYAFSKNLFVAVDSIREDLDARNDISYSPDGELVSFTHYGWIKIFSTTPRLYEIDELARSDKWSLGSKFSCDGKLLVTYYTDSILIIWDIAPVTPSLKYSVSSWVNNKLTIAQRKILTIDVLEDIHSRVDKSLTVPRDEFETSSSFKDRSSTLEDWTLALVQEITEERFKIKDKGSGQVAIPIQGVIGYNADKQIYKIRFLEVEAGVKIPIKEAKQLKASWEKARIIANKTKQDNGLCSIYDNYQMEIPGITNTFEVSPLENPLYFQNIRSVSLKDANENEFPEDKAQQAENKDIISHALLFATNIYDSFSELVNPVLDANTIAAELSENYGVDTEVVLNPTLMQTAEKIREYASKEYGENENLILFFAGHGVYDDVFKEGYVISTDSRADDISKTSYLSHSNLRTMVNNIGCKHIFLVMDVCFGGTFDPHLSASAHRGAMEMYAEIPKEEFIQRKTKYKTRLYLTSGGKEYVPDGRSGFHSPFARRFIESLRKYGGEDGVLTTGEILQYVEKVNPQPRFGEFGDNEPGSDFILISK